MSNYKLDIVPSEYDPRDHIYDKRYAGKEKVKTPKKLDLRPEMTEIRDQGDQGSCFAHAAAAMKEWQEYHDSEYTDYFSRQFIYDHRKDTDERGMRPRYGMKILKELGCPKSSLYEYGEPRNKDEIPDEVYQDALLYRISKYERVEKIDSLKKSLVANGPAIIGVPIYNYGPRMWLPNNNNNEVKGGHAMTIVGFTKKGFIIRNSWGKRWGHRGFTIFPYEDWGCQWEIWTSVDIVTDVVKSKNALVDNVQKELTKVTDNVDEITKSNRFVEAL